MTATPRLEALRAAGPPLLGLVVLAAVTLAGQDGIVFSAVASPPPVARIALGAAAILLGIVLLGRGLERLDHRDEPAMMVRGVRLLFLAVGAFVAGAGWFAGAALALVVALVIAAVDVVETSFLLLVTAPRGPRPHDRA